jgi:hypothetical protein
MGIKTTTVTDLVNQLQEQVNNHSIYVWGASGQLCKDINEKWIRAKESRNNGGKNADDAVAAWKKVMESPYRNVARAFDCSGYVSYCLLQLGAADKRRDCDGIFSRCQQVSLSSKPQNGTFLFRVNSKDKNDETHIGVYSNGYQFHAKGRKYGVVKEKFNPNYWAKAGWYKYLEKDYAPQPEPEPDKDAYTFTRVLKYGSVGDDVVEMKKLLISKGYTKGISVDKKSSTRFGSSTKALVKHFQRDNGLRVDGLAGKETLTALGGIWGA